MNHENEKSKSAEEETITDFEKSALECEQNGKFDEAICWWDAAAVTFAISNDIFKIVYCYEKAVSLNLLLGNLRTAAEDQERLAFTMEKILNTEFTETAGRGGTFRRVISYAIDAYQQAYILYKNATQPAYASICKDKAKALILWKRNMETPKDHS